MLPEAFQAALWWMGICGLGLILVIGVIWTGRQIVVDDELEALGAKRKKAFQDDVWKIGSKYGAAMNEPTLKDLIVELKKQLERADSIESDRWTSAREKMLDIDARLKAIEDRLEGAGKKS